MQRQRFRESEGRNGVCAKRLQASYKLVGAAGLVVRVCVDYIREGPLGQRSRSSGKLVRASVKVVSKNFPFFLHRSLLAVVIIRSDNAVSGRAGNAVILERSVAGLAVRSARVALLEIRV